MGLCHGFVSLLHGVMGWSAVCDCDISRQVSRMKRVENAFVERSTLIGDCFIFCPSGHAGNEKAL